MAEVTLHVRNARSQIKGLREDVFRLLSYELAYPVAEPGMRAHVQPDGSVKMVFWDGYTRLLRPSGVFPSGLVTRALRLLRKWLVRVRVVDERIRPEDRDPRWVFPDGFALRDYQVEACAEAYRVGRGVFDSPPRTGKTVMMAEMIRRVSTPTVITSPTIPIAQQTFSKLQELLTCGSPRDIVLLTGGPPKSTRARRQLSGALVFVCTAETAVAMPADWWGKVRCLMVDERHHQAALRTYGAMSDLASGAYWRWGFTGTNFRSNPGEQVALEACLGRTVARFTIRDMQARGVLVPGRVTFRTFQADRIPDRTVFDKAYVRGVVRSAARNGEIAAVARELVADGRRVLILVHRIEHGERLASLIPGSRFVQSADGPDVRAAVADLDRGDVRCLIGSPVVGEGLDCPAADALIYAKGKRARVTHTQDTFRVLTAASGKRDAVIVDFVDAHNSTLLDHAVERMRNYLTMDLQVGVDRGGSVRSQSGQLGFGPVEAPLTIQS